MQLIISLTKAKMLEAARSGARFDLRQMVERVPSATIVSGNPAVSVEVEVAPEHADSLRRSVQGFCTVGPYVELDLFGTSRRR